MHFGTPLTIVTTRMAWLRMLDPGAQDEAQASMGDLHFVCLNCWAEFAMPSDTTLAAA